MADKTYIELNKNDKKTVQISIWNNTGVSVIPSAAFYQVKGSLKDNIIIPKSPANIDNNKVYATITSTVTASASEYDILWEIRKDDGSVRNHCTKVLVLDC